MILDLHPSDYLIFVVDADKKQLEFLHESFSKWGFQVKAFSDGDSALVSMQKGVLPHVLFADIQMPGLSGVGLAKRAKVLSSEVEVVFMTTTPTVDSLLEALRLGIHDYLLKPFDKLDDIRKVIFHVCERIYLRLYNEYLVSELKLKNEEIRGLSHISAELAEVIDVGNIIEIGCRYLSKAFKGAEVCFLQFIPQDSTLMMAARSPPELFGKVQTKYPIPRDEGSSIALVSDYFKKVEKDEKFLEMLESADSMSPKEIQRAGIWKAFPFVTRQIPRGIFVLKTQDWDEELLRPLAHRYLQTLEKYFENALLHKRVFEMSVKDGLTGLYNVRAFREKLTQEIKTAERIQHPLSLLFLDVDHFKKYNDNHGHPAGDLVLKTIASLLQTHFRTTDYLARYGGEEFCVILTHTELGSALKKAEFFRQIVEQHAFPHAETQPLGKISVSIGVSEYPTHAGSAEPLVKLADDALYNAKKESRNVVKSAVKDTSHIPPFESKHVSTGR